MDDLTLLYYTPNTNPKYFQKTVRAHLLQVTDGKIPIVSVSQKPIDFGLNICVGEIGRSLYNAHKQIFTGVQKVKTKYVALCEDDTLYNMEHFSHRPPAEDVFAYNQSMWNVEPKKYWRIVDFPDHYMGFCICSTKALLKNFKARFDMYPSPIPPDDFLQLYFQEPGKFDRHFGIPNAKFENFRTAKPILTFNFRGSIMGKRRSSLPTTSEASLSGWGNSMDLCTKFYGTKYV
jgi:hypothetical protein